MPNVPNVPNVLTAATPLTQDRFQHAEGPVWDVAESRLLFVDMLEGNLVIIDGIAHRRPPRTTILHVDDVLAFIRPRRDGGWIAGSASSILILNEEFAVVDRREILHDRRTRFNEGGCDAHGILYAGTMAEDATPGLGALYRFDQHLKPEIILSNVTVSNGFVPRPYGVGNYYVDSATRRIDILTVDGGRTTREPFVIFGADDGNPDGLAVDTDGGVWAALWGSGRVQRYDPSGSLTHVVALPTSQVSSCAFGGLDRSTLFIKTSQVESTEGDSLAGAVFSIDTDFRGFELASSVL